MDERRTAAKKTDDDDDDVLCESINKLVFKLHVLL